MNVDRILQALNDGGGDHLLLGGVNFLLHRRPELTFDVDAWIRDTPGNRTRCETVLDTLPWAEAQTPVRRNSPAACLRIERRRRETLSATWSEQP